MKHRQQNSPPSKVRSLLQQDKALKLRAQGLTYAQIAQRMGYKDRKSSYELVQQAFRRLAARVEERATHLRDLEDAHLDALREVVTPAALEPEALDVPQADGTSRLIEQVNLSAIMVALRLHDRKVRLHGLAAPSKVDVTLSPLMQAVLEAWPDNAPPRVPVAPPALASKTPVEWEEEAEDEEEESNE